MNAAACAPAPDVAATLTGAVVRVVHRSPSFVVLLLRPDGDGERSALASVCGCLPPVEPGERLRIEGAWESSARWGQQFRASSARVEVPVTEDGLVACLAQLVEGVGPGIARKLVAECGGVVGALRHLSDPAVAVTWAGFSPRAALLFRSLRDAWRERHASHELEAALASLGLTPALRAAVRARYGEDAANRCRTRPYDLAIDVEGFGFKRADEVAKASGVKLDSPERIQAALSYALAEEASTRGHVYTSVRQATRIVASLCLGACVSEADVHAAAAELARRGAIVVGEASGDLGIRRLVEAERDIAARVEAMTSPDNSGSLGTSTEFDFATSGLVDEQRAAVDLARRFPFVLLTGGPGVGKTTTTKAICSLWSSYFGDRSFALCAPTGRAARRLAEATGKPAQTIHRLLGFHPKTQGFVHDASDPLDLDALLVDECSMVDVELLRSLLVALRPGCRVVLVGDADQLPPVGPGAPFRDLVGAADAWIEAWGNGSGRLPIARLVQVHRQAAGSRIIGASRDVMTGRAPVPSATGDRSEGALFALEEGESSLAARVVELVQSDIPESFGIPSGEVQVIAPMRKGSAGVDALNRALQAAINPRPPEECYAYKAGERELEYRVGDRVMQTKNDYKKGVVNGEIGTVAEMLVHGERDKAAPVLAVRFLDGEEDKIVPFTRGELARLDLAYCTTVHKVQGAEFRSVVVVCADSHAHMLERSLLYTALTRAKKLCVLVGSMKAIKRAAKTARSDGRRTTLGGRLG